MIFYIERTSNNLFSRTVHTSDNSSIFSLINVMSFLVMVSPSKNIESAVVDVVSDASVEELVIAAVVHASLLHAFNSDSANAELLFSTN